MEWSGETRLVPLERMALMSRIGFGGDATKSENNPLSISELCKLLVANGNTHTGGYFHYTTIDRLRRMIEGKCLDGENIPRKLFYLSAVESLNDVSEVGAKPPRRVFVGSFSFGSEEEVSMWTNYGVPKANAIRVRFSKKAINEWLLHNTKRDIALYGVKEDPTHSVSRLRDVAAVFVGFVDMAYFGRNRMAETSSDGVLYRGKSFRLKESKWREKISTSTDLRSAMFKKHGWAYEHEVRLLIELKDPLPAQFVKLAVDFTGPLDAICRDPVKCMTLGPWYKEGNESFSWFGSNLANAPKSVFHDELRMRSVCDSCDKKAECNCAFADWRCEK